MRVIC